METVEGTKLIEVLDRGNQRLSNLVWAVMIGNIQLIAAYNWNEIAGNSRTKLLKSYRGLAVQIQWSLPPPYVTSNNCRYELEEYYSIL